MLDYQRTPLYNEVLAIQRDGVNGTAYSYKAYVYAKKEGKVYEAPKVLSIDVLRDYVSNYTDKMIINLYLTRGVFAHHVYKSKDELEIMLVRIPIFNTDGKRDKQRHRLVERFTAIIVNETDPNVNEGRELSDEQVLDLSGLVEVEFELQSKTAELIGLTRCGGIMRNTTTSAFLKSVFTNEANQEAGDANLIIKGVDMIESNNTEVRDHIIIPHGMRLVDLPEYVQKKCGGVYPTGMGYYLQERYWYIYPSMDFTRISDTERVITFINIPKNKLPRIERTFRYNGDQIIALATGDFILRDTVATNTRNEGNGTSFTVASSVLHTMTQQGESKVKLDRKASNTEAATIDHPAGYTYVPTSNTPITDNAMEEFSKIARKQAGSIALVWENSEPTAIVPGMMARVFYVKDGKVVDAVGVIGAVQHYTYLAQKGFTSDRYIHSSMVTIFTDTKELSKRKGNNK